MREKKNPIKRLHRNNWVSKCPTNTLSWEWALFLKLNGRESVVCFCRRLQGLWPVKFSVLLVTLKTHTHAHGCTVAVIVPAVPFALTSWSSPSSLPSYSPFTPSSSTPSGPVHYCYQHFLSAALCYGNITLHIPSTTTTTPLVVQSKPFNSHAGAMMARLYIPHSICSWHSCITYALLTSLLSAFALSSSHSLLCFPLSSSFFPLSFFVSF